MSSNQGRTPEELRAMALHLFQSSNHSVQVLTEELRRHAARAASTLQGLALVQTFLTLGLWISILAMNLTQQSSMMTTAQILTAVSFFFWILHSWALSEPLPAAIVGLIVYVALTVSSFVALLGASQASAAGGILLYLPILRLLVVGYLLRAIIAGVRHRRLTRQANNGNLSGPVLIA
jgi:hypothetical protein